MTRLDGIIWPFSRYLFRPSRMDSASYFSLVLTSKHLQVWTSWLKGSSSSSIVMSQEGNWPVYEGESGKKKKLQNRLNIFVSASSQISMTLVQKVPAIENKKMLYLQLRSTMYNIFYTVILSQIKTWVYIFSKQPCIWYTQSQKIQFSDVHIICRSLNEVSEIFQKIFLGGNRSTSRFCRSLTISFVIPAPLCPLSITWYFYM